MKSIAWIAITLVAATALAGCTQQPPAEPSGNPTSVSITRAPEGAAPNSNVVVCWRVEGTGTIPHTALHTDTTSHPGNAGFADYKGTTFYPNNATSASSVSLPGDFCTAVAVRDQPLYLRAHAMVSAPGVVSAERQIAIRAATAVIGTVTLGSTNSTAQANSTVPVCWTVTGSGNIPHTAIHADTATHPAATTFQDYKGATYYPNNRTSADAVGYDLPGTFCTGVVMPANGTLYFRAHAMTNTPPGVISPTEGRIAVSGSTGFNGTVTTVTFRTTPPATAPRGSMQLVCIQVAGTGVVPHVAIHTDTSSHATELTDFTVYKGATYYPENATAANPMGYNTSGAVHCTNVRVPDTLGTILYIRGHAVDSMVGINRLTPDEKSITAT